MSLSGRRVAAVHSTVRLSSGRSRRGAGDEESDDVAKRDSQRSSASGRYGGGRSCCSRSPCFARDRLRVERLATGYSVVGVWVGRQDGSIRIQTVSWSLASTSRTAGSGFGSKTTQPVLRA